MEGIPTNEIFEQRLIQLKVFCEWLSKQEYRIKNNFGSDSDYRTYKMGNDMMPFEFIEDDLRKHISIPLVQRFGASGIRASFDHTDGVKIWFTNSLDESADFKSAKESMQQKWDEIKNNW